MLHKSNVLTVAQLLKVSMFSGQIFFRGIFFGSSKNLVFRVQNNCCVLSMSENFSLF